MELWSEIRRRVLAGDISMRQACSAYHLNFRTVRKIVRENAMELYGVKMPETVGA